VTHSLSTPVPLTVRCPLWYGRGVFRSLIYSPAYPETSLDQRGSAAILRAIEPAESAVAALTILCFVLAAAAGAKTNRQLAGRIASMMNTKRRQAPRMTVNELAYVNLGPDNGGIILNISEGGLCFQSTAPVQRTKAIRFWFSYCNRRIDPDEGQAWKDEAQTRGVSRYIETGSELVWTDDTQKRGGLRFTNLRPEAREQIRDWIRQPMLDNVNGKSVSSFPSGKRSLTNALRGASARFEVLFCQIQSLRSRTGFSGGLVAGVVLSALLVAVFVLLFHAYHVELNR